MKGELVVRDRWAFRMEYTILREKCTNEKHVDDDPRRNPLTVDNERNSRI